MKVYLSARYARREEMVGYKAQLEAAGHMVMSRWVDGNHEGDPNDPAQMQTFADADLMDVQASDTLVTFTESTDVYVPGAERGGRHVEWGIAIAENLECVVIGPYENVFHTLGDSRFDTFAEWLGPRE